MKKGKRSYYGYKAFAAVDCEDGYITTVRVKPANAPEVKELPSLVAAICAVRFYSDKGYASESNRQFLREWGFKDGIMRKGYRNHPLSCLDKRINKFISRRRYVVEQGFGTLKRLFGFSRASSVGLEKVESQFC
ncbi:MAG: transposase [Deltaproteobacteria bacterium]|nr:transposase [Deltaproteobacteria bacterium]